MSFENKMGKTLDIFNEKSEAEILPPVHEDKDIEDDYGFAANTFFYTDGLRYISRTGLDDK